MRSVRRNDGQPRTPRPTTQARRPMATRRRANAPANDRRGEANATELARASEGLALVHPVAAVSYALALAAAGARGLVGGMVLLPSFAAPPFVPPHCQTQLLCLAACPESHTLRIYARSRYSCEAPQFTHCRKSGIEPCGSSCMSR